MDSNDGWVEICVRVPEIFMQLAHYYDLTPERIAGALVYSFACAPPRSLTLIQRGQVAVPQASDDLGNKTRWLT
jgi:hypothetical protein